MNQTKAYAKTIKARPEASPEFKEISRPTPKRTFRSDAERYAGDSFFYVNHYYPGGKEMFPNQPKMQVVDKFFPYALGGPLFVDEFHQLESADTIKTKTEAMKKLSHRYLPITPGMTELEAMEILA